MPTLASRIEKVARALHRELFRRTRGRFGGSLAGQDVLLLTTVGRRSGLAYTVPLVSLALGNGSYLVAGSNASDPERNPAWLHNLRANPTVEIELPGRERQPAVATEVPKTEYAALWKRLTDSYPRFLTYQARTKRPIPLVRLRPS